jgi:hypothetical protein
MVIEYNPRGGIVYWGGFSSKFPDLKEILQKEFGLVSRPKHPDEGDEGDYLVYEEDGSVIWSIVFCKMGYGRKETDTVGFRYEPINSSEEIYNKDPMIKVAERVYEFLDDFIEKATTDGIIKEIILPWEERFVKDNNIDEFEMGEPHYLIETDKDISEIELPTHGGFNKVKELEPEIHSWL